MKIVQRLVLIVLLAAIPLGLLPAYNVHQGQLRQRAQISSDALQTANRAAAEQRRIVEGARQLLAALSQIPAIQGDDAARCSLILRRLQAQFPIYIAIGVADLRGRIWCSSSLPGTDISDRAYFKEAVRTRRFTTGGYIIGRVLHRKSLNFSMAFDSPSGGPAGVIVAGLDLDQLAIDLGKSQLPPDTTLSIIGPDKRVLVDLPDGSGIGTALPARFLPMFEARQAGTIETEWLDGSDRLVGFVPPAADASMPFLVAVGIDRAKASAAVARRATHEAAILFLTVTAAMLLAWWFAMRFVRRPMRHLTNTVRAWGEGRTTVRVGPLDSGSEFEDLGRAFDALAEEVEDRQRRLRDTLESTSDSVLAVTPDWTVSYLNRNARKRLGEDLLGHNLWRAFPDVEDAAVAKALRRAMVHRVPVTVSFEYKQLGGHFEANAFPVPEGGLTLFVKDVTDQRRAQEELLDLALNDPLTALPNRANAMAIAEQNAAEGQLSAMILIDLDGFKHVNDIFGHPAGDEILKGVAERLSSCIEGSGVIARLGGDEFIAVLVKTDAQRSVELGHALLDCLGRKPFLVRGRMHHITASCGVVLADDESPVSVQGLFANADLALYRAKAAGSGTCHVYTTADREAYQARRLLEEDLSRATAAGEFELYYQPQVRLADNRLIGAEALLRWRHPTHGLMEPAAFIEILTHSRHARTVGEWTLDQACREAAAWRDAGHALRVGVNLFPEQVRAGDLPEVVQRILAAHSLSAQALDLEVTENVALRAEESTKATLLALRALGVGLAFDDFGTGFASLTSLKDIPVHRLKIDRGFVTHLPDNGHDRAIVEAVLALARTLELEVVAEGVETAEQEDYLRARGCQEAQGFRYARPMPAADFRAYILASKNGVILSEGV